MNLFIIDTSVIFHLINARLQQYALGADDKHLYVEASLRWIHSLGMMPYFADAQGCHCIWAMDSKPYWRSLYFPDYKATRPKTTEGISYIFDIFSKLSLPHLCIAGYEADDIAALFCVLFRQRPLRSAWQCMYLLTIDSDWQGLITDGITWVDVNNHEPRIRDEERVYDWFVTQYFKQPKKWQHEWPLPDQHAFHPTDIWRWKAVVGDRPDNLPPGAEPWLINLYEPHPDHVLWRCPDIVKEARQLIDTAKHPAYSAKEMTIVLNGIGLTMPLSYIV